MAGVSSNPINIIRTSNHKSLSEFSTAMHVNLQTLYLNECGVYPDILPKIRNYLIRVVGADEDELDTRYKQFQTDKRKLFSRQHKDKLEDLPEPDLTIHPMEQFRLYLHPKMTRTKFSKDICVEPAGMYRLETCPLPNIPGRISSGLLEIGLSPENLEELQERVHEFYARHR